MLDDDNDKLDIRWMRCNAAPDEVILLSFIFSIKQCLNPQLWSLHSYTQCVDKPLSSSYAFTDAARIEDFKRR